MAHYERGKRILHPIDTIENLKILENMLKEQHPSQIEKLDKTLDELKEIVSRFIPQKPDGEWIAGRDGYSCPRCPCWHKPALCLARSSPSAGGTRRILPMSLSTGCRPTSPAC